MAAETEDLVLDVDDNVVKQARERYEFLLHKIAIPAVGNGITNDEELFDAARPLFGHHFAGVFPVDQLPETLGPHSRDKRHPTYAILNLSRTPELLNGESGTHWIAVAYLAPQALLVYDSFGKLHDVPVEIAERYPESVTTNVSPDQHNQERNCGARALAWLMLFDLYGSKQASLI